MTDVLSFADQSIRYVRFPLAMFSKTNISSLTIRHEQLIFHKSSLAERQWQENRRLLKSTLILKNTFDIGIVWIERWQPVRLLCLQPRPENIGHGRMSVLIDMEPVDTLDQLPRFTALRDPSLNDLLEWKIEIVNVVILCLDGERRVSHGTR